MSRKNIIILLTAIPCGKWDEGSVGGKARSLLDTHVPLHTSTYTGPRRRSQDPRPACQELHCYFGFSPDSICFQPVPYSTAYQEGGGTWLERILKP